VSPPRLHQDVKGTKLIRPVDGKTVADLVTQRLLVDRPERSENERAESVPEFDDLTRR
jgi:hypothetical protein